MDIFDIVSVRNSSHGTPSKNDRSKDTDVLDISEERIEQTAIADEGVTGCNAEADDRMSGDHIECQNNCKGEERTSNANDVSAEKIPTSRLAPNESSDNSKEWSAEHPLKLQRLSPAFNSFRPETESLYRLKLKYIHDSSALYLQNSGHQPWVKMCRDLTQYCLNTSQLVPLHNPVLNTFCLVWCARDGLYYRARYLGHNNSQSVIVVFFDFGKYEIVSEDKCYELPQLFWSVESPLVIAYLDINKSCRYHNRTTSLEEIMSQSSLLQISFKYSQAGECLVKDLVVENESLLQSLRCDDCGSYLFRNEDNQETSDGKLPTLFNCSNVSVPSVVVPIVENVPINFLSMKEYLVNCTLSNNAFEQAELVDRLNTLIETTHNKSLDVIPTIGQYYGVQKHPYELWVRCIVTGVDSGVVCVRCIDSGEYFSVSCCELTVLPEIYCKFPAQCFQFRLEDNPNVSMKMIEDILALTKPGDISVNLTKSGSEYVALKIYVHDLPLSGIAAMANDSVTINDTLADFMNHKLWASTAMKSLTAAIEVEFFDSVATPVSTVEIEESFVVNFPCIHSDRPLFAKLVRVEEDTCQLVLRLTEDELAINDLLRELNRYMDTSLILPFSSIPNDNTYCIARNDSTSTWFRGKVLPKNWTQGNRVTILNIDTGETQITTVLNVFPIPKEFSLLPAQILFANMMLNHCPTHENCTAVAKLLELPPDLELDLDPLSSDSSSVMIRQLTAGGCIILPSDLCQVNDLNNSSYQVSTLSNPIRWPTKNPLNTIPELEEIESSGSVKSGSGKSEVSKQLQSSNTDEQFLDVENNLKVAANIEYVPDENLGLEKETNVYLKSENIKSQSNEIISNTKSAVTSGHL